ncbi:MAG TPA: hypothetical protein VME41_02795 [Stellaceae bacterium]|nr:hypothetical protein [Stellaceae bacterium]
MRVAPYDVVGFAGATIAIVAYFMNQQRWLSSENWRFPAANLLAASVILVSLVFEWNFPSVVIEIFWAAISLWGLIRALAHRTG